METPNEKMIENFYDFMDRLTKKDKKAWDFFINQYGHLMYSYVIRTLKRYQYYFQKEEAEDIFHKVFVALLDKDCQKLKNFRGKNERTFKAYLREICFHITIDFLREQRSFMRLDEIQSHIYYEQYDNLDKKDLKAILSLLIDDLADRHKYLFKLIYEEELEIAEVAEIMKLNINAIHQLKFRMLNSLIKIAKKKRGWYAKISSR